MILSRQLNPSGCYDSCRCRHKYGIILAASCTAKKKLIHEQSWRDQNIFSTAPPPLPPQNESKRRKIRKIAITDMYDWPSVKEQIKKLDFHNHFLRREHKSFCVFFSPKKTGVEIKRFFLIFSLPKSMVYDGACVNDRKKIQFFSSIVFPKTAEFKKKFCCFWKNGGEK